MTMITSITPIADPRGTVSLEAINDAGEVGGFVAVPLHIPYVPDATEDVGYLWPDSGALPASSLSVIHGINESGELAGVFVGIHANEATVVADGVVTYLPGFSTLSSNAFAINRSGEVVGYSQISEGPAEACLWRDGAIIDLGNLFPGQPVTDGRSDALAINDAGQVVGYSTVAGAGVHAFEWQDGAMTDLGALSSVSASEAMAINQEGVVVGWGTASNGMDHALIWQNGRIADLGVGTGFTNSHAWAINDLGLIVGSFSNLPDGNDHAALWRDGQAIDLNTLLPANSGWVLQNAGAINDENQVVGSGTFDGVEQGFVLSLDAPDIANLAGSAGAYVISGAAGAVSVSGNGVSETLSNLMALRFDDRTVIVAAAPGANSVTTGTVTELYSAVFAREPDIAGLAFYQDYLKADPATPLLQFAEWFLASPEYAAAHAYAPTSAGDRQFIIDSYQNLLHRTPTAAEIAYYQTNVMAAGGQSHAQMLVYFSASAEFLHDVQITATQAADARHWLVLT